MNCGGFRVAYQPLQSDKGAISQTTLTESSTKPIHINYDIVYAYVFSLIFSRCSAKSYLKNTRVGG